MNVEWDDEFGDHHVLVETPIVLPVESLDYHPFENELRRYLLGDVPVKVAAGCWCRLPDDHWIHDVRTRKP